MNLDNLSKEDLAKFIRKQTKKVKEKEKEALQLAELKENLENQLVEKDAEIQALKESVASTTKDDKDQDSSSHDASLSTHDLEQTFKLRELELEEEVKKKVKENDIALARTKEILQRFKKLQAKCKSMTTEKEESDAELRKFAQESKKHKERIEELEMKNQSLQEMMRQEFEQPSVSSSNELEMSSLKEELNNARAEISSLMEELNATRAESKLLKERHETAVQDLNSQHEESLQKHKDDLERQTNTLQNEKDGLLEQIKELETSFSDKLNSIESLNAELSSKTGMVAELELKLEQSESKASPSQSIDIHSHPDFISLSKELSDITNKVHSLEFDLREKEGQNSELRAEILLKETNLSTAVESAQAEMELKLQQLQEDARRGAQESEASSERIIEQLKVQLHETSASNVAERSKLEQQIKELEEKVEEYQDQRRTDAEVLQSANEVILEKEALLNAIQLELEEYKTKREGADQVGTSPDVSVQLREKEERVKTLELQLNEQEEVNRVELMRKEEEISDLQSQLEALRSAGDGASMAELETRDQKIKSLELQLTEKDREEKNIAQLTHDLADKVTEIESIQSRLETLSDMLEGSQRNAAHLKAEVERKESEIEDMKTQMKQEAITETAEKEGAAAEWEILLSEKEDELSQLRSELERVSLDFEEQLTRSKNVLQDKSEQIAALEARLDDAMVVGEDQKEIEARNLLEKEKQISDLIERLNFIAPECESVQNELSELKLQYVKLESQLEERSSRVSYLENLLGNVESGGIAKENLETIAKENLERITELENQLAEKSAKLVQFEESRLTFSERKPSIREHSEPLLDQALQQLAIAEVKESIALDLCVFACADAVKKQESASEKYEAISAECSTQQRKAGEWQRKANEIGKRFKVLKTKLQSSSGQSNQIRNKYFGAVVNLVERSMSRNLELSRSFSIWRQATKEAELQDLRLNCKSLAEESLANMQSKQEGAIADRDKTIQDLKHSLESLQEEKSNLSKRFNAQETNVKKLKKVLKGKMAQIKSFEAKTESLNQPPPGFDPLSDVICTIAIPFPGSKAQDEEVWVCLDARGRNNVVDQVAGESSTAGASDEIDGMIPEHDKDNQASTKDVDGGVEKDSESMAVEWVPVEKLKVWIEKYSEQPGRAALVRRFQIPETVQKIIRMEEAGRVQEAQEQAAWALAQLETMKGDLAKYKRNAQIALKKAKEESSKASAQMEASENHLKVQLQTELARVTRLADKRQEELELAQAEKLNIEVSLTAAQQDLEVSTKMYEKLERSIADRMQSLRENLELSHTQQLQEEQDRLSSQLHTAQTQAKTLESSCESLKAQNLQLESTVQALSRSKDELTKIISQLEVEVADSHKQLASKMQAQGSAGPASKQRRSRFGGYPSEGSGSTPQHPIYESEEEVHSPDSASPRPAYGPESVSTEKRIVQERYRQRQYNTGIVQQEPNASVLAAATTALYPPGTKPASENGHDESTDFPDEFSSVSNMNPRHSALESLPSNSPFVDQLELLHSQHARDRISWQRELDQQREKVEDLEHENRLLLEQNGVLKEDIREIGRSKTREDQLGRNEEDPKRTQESLTYLKNVVYKYMAAREVSERKTLLPVVATMLQFSPQETTNLKTFLETERSGVVGWVFGQ